MRCVSATETVTLREHRETGKGSEGVGPPAEGWRGKLLCGYGGHRSMAQIYGDRIDYGITGGLRLCIRIDIRLMDKDDYC